jgi:hypothetical protein
MDLNAYPILTVLIIATASSMLAELPLRFRVPMVVWEMILGMISRSTCSLHGVMLVPSH